MIVLRGALAAALLLALGSTDRVAFGQQAGDAEPIYLDEPEPVPPPVVVSSGKVGEKYESGELRIEREVLKMSDDQTACTTARGASGTRTANSARP
jgi:hypothetical protein